VHVVQVGPVSCIRPGDGPGVFVTSGFSSFPMFSPLHGGVNARPALKGIMTFVASPRKRSVGCVYAGRCVYAPDAAFTHTCLYAGVGAYTQVRAYTHPRVRIRG